MKKNSNMDDPAAYAEPETRNRGNRYDMNDSGTAERVMASRKGDVLWVEDGKDGHWVIWNGDRWRRDAEERRVELWVRETTLEMQAEAKELLAAAVGNEELQKAARAMYKFAISSGNDRAIKAVLSRMKMHCGAAPSALDSNPALIATPNGVIELCEDGAIWGDAAPADMISKSTRTKYDRKAKSNLWDNYLDTFLPDMEVRLFLQKLIGYGMYGRNNEKLIVFLHGGGNTGKSTLINMIESTFGEYAASMSLSSLRGKFDNGPREDIANIARARFALASESGAEWELHADQVKRFTGGVDRITFQRKYGREESVTPEFLPIIATNGAPRIKSADKATIARICVVPFNVEVEVSDDGDKLANNRQARVAFLAWCVDGWDLYAKEGLNRDEWPPAVRAIKAEYKEEINPLSAFVSECCEVGEDLWSLTSPLAPLYQAYQGWAEDCGEKPMSAPAFGTQMTHLGFKKVQKKINGKKEWIRVGVEALQKR